MGDIITMPGFYTSKAGKCEVKDCDGRFAIGWCNLLPVVWHCGTGHAQRPIEDIHNITGPWVDPPPKRHEQWTNVYPCGRNSTFDGNDGQEVADKCAALNPGRIGPARHMVELREGECIVPQCATIQMIDAAKDTLGSELRTNETAIRVWNTMIAARPRNA
jgi:hypothetical protein